MPRAMPGVRRANGDTGDRPLPNGRDLWIFAYGSLMWDPGFPFEEARPALLRGYHRSFCVYSHRYRGTPDRPGLVLGLDSGGACRGIAYRVASHNVKRVMAYLWRREMTGRTYTCREVRIHLAGHTVRARAFVVRRDHPQYAPDLSVARTVELVCQGKGMRGACLTYLENTVRHLDELGIPDRRLHAILKRAEARLRRVRPVIASRFH
ncbi:MAG TPA: gamma-glutamylcyclotransferase [Alphaproteobacteria bacterium]